MKRIIFIAALLLLASALIGCDMINKIIPNKDASISNKAEGDTVSFDGADVSVISSSATSLTGNIENNTDSTWQSGNMRDSR